ncbi:uncharacterized protein LOC132700391 [Cylas formicarius]|uniref:uncharacterized protein LOC132700391 n=1 Tax=Cylas formicarius TaxID=197179 RepID=UPI0029586B38|nr:uncharacterized protein LOC132700391 [Cylas formicarius]
MVIPIDKSKLYSTCPVNYVGNNMNLQFSTNYKFLLITGNNISVDIGKNYGLLKVLGNNCKVNIAECHGFVDYCGNNGRIAVSGKIDDDTISYSGNNGNIITEVYSKWNSDVKKYPTQQVCSSFENCFPSAPLIIENNVLRASRSIKMPQIVFGRHFIKINNY